MECTIVPEKTFWMSWKVLEFSLSKIVGTLHYKLVTVVSV